MDYEEENSGVVGKAPEFGAIFMSNTATKRECFKRKLFGLPSGLANFVKQVKAGMVLFLFEFEKRELFGVFQATYDGAMNIVPNAFSSSAKHFPAQVRFTPIWFCSPLSENEFRDAIRENYFSAKKFSFGLSEDQVHRLLCLFSTRKLKNKLPQRQFPREVTRPTRKVRRQVDDDDSATISDRVEFEPDIGDGLGSAIFSEYSGNTLDSLKRVDDNKFSMDDMVEREHKMDYSLGRDIWTDYRRDSWGKKGRTDNHSRSMTSDATANECFDDRASGQAIWSEDLGDSLGKVRRIADDSQFSMGDRLKVYRDMDNNIEPVISTDYLENSFNKVRRVADDNRFLMVERAGNEFNMDNGFVKVRLASDDGGFFMNNSSVENERKMDNGFGPVNVSEHLGKFLKERGTGDSRLLMDNRLGNERRVHQGINPVILAEQFKNRPGRTSVIRDRVEKENKVDNSFGSAISNDYSRYAIGKDRRVADDGRFRKSDMDSFLGPVISTGYTDFSRSKQNPLIYSRKPILKTDYSSLPDQLRHSSAIPCSKEAQIFDRPYPTSHDAIVTKTVPYDPDVPDICSRLSPFTDCYNSNLVLDRPSYKGFEGNFLPSSKSKSSTYHYKPQSLKRSLEIPLSNSNTSNHHDHSLHGTNNAFSNTRYFGIRELETSTHEGHRGSLFAEPSLLPVPFSKGEINNYPISYALSPIKNPSFALKNGYPVDSHGDHRNKIPWAESDVAFTGREFPSSDARWSHLQYGASSEARGLNLYEKDSVDHENEQCQSSESNHSDTKNNRTSVFARLSLAPELSIQEQENDTNTVYDEDIAASVDEVMDMLRQGQNHRVKLSKHKSLVRQHDGDENVWVKKQSTIQEYEQSMIPPMKIKSDTEIEIDANRTIEKNGGDSVLEETRLVDFKRRSEMRKKLNETTTKDSVGISEDKTTNKRRKLVRPAFGEKESSDDFFDEIPIKVPISTQNLQLPSQESSLSKDNARKNCENGDILARNVGLIRALFPTSCEGNNTNSEKSSECKEQGNLENCGTTSRCCEGEEDGRTPSNVILNSLSELLSKDKNKPMAMDLSSQDLGTIDCLSNAKESPPEVLYEVTADLTNYLGNEDLFRDVENTKEICPQF